MFTPRSLGVALLFFLAACSSPQLTPPPLAPSSSFTGLWLGKVADNVGAAAAEMVLIQTGTSLTGELVLSFSVGLVKHNATGTATGRVDGASLELWLVPDDANYCSYHAVASRSGGTLQGSYEGIDCREKIEGTLTLRKQ